MFHNLNDDHTFCVTILSYFKFLFYFNRPTVCFLTKFLENLLQRFSFAKFIYLDTTITMTHQPPIYAIVYLFHTTTISIILILVYFVTLYN